MIWLGERAGYLSDWITQQWVRSTGRRVSLEDHGWLSGPVGNPRGIGTDFYREYAEKNDLEVVDSGARGLLPDFGVLAGSSCHPDMVSAVVKDFYERTSAYELDAWSEWHGFFKPFGAALALIFSRRLRQLNLPLSPLDSSLGMTSMCFGCGIGAPGSILKRRGCGNFARPGMSSMREVTPRAACRAIRALA